LLFEHFAPSQVLTVVRLLIIKSDSKKEETEEALGGDVGCWACFVTSQPATGSTLNEILLGFQFLQILEADREKRERERERRCVCML
jgi:hypothetical protein